MTLYCRRWKRVEFVWEAVCLPVYMMFVVVTSEYRQMWLMLKPGKGSETGERWLLLCWIGKEGNGLLSCLSKSKCSTAMERYWRKRRIGLKNRLRGQVWERYCQTVARLCSTERAEARLKRASRVRAWMWTGCLARSEGQGRSEKGWQSQKTELPEIGCLGECVLFLGL